MHLDIIGVLTHRRGGIPQCGRAPDLRLAATAQRRPRGQLAYCPRNDPFQAWPWIFTSARHHNSYGFADFGGRGI